MQGTPARRSGTGSAVRMLRGLAPVGQGGAQPGRAVIQIQIAVRGVAVHTQALIRGSLNRTIPASGHATLDARRVTIQVRRRSGRAECLGSGHHGEGAAKKHRPAGKPGAGNLNKRDRHKTIQSENKTRPCYAVAARWKRQQRAAGSSSTTAKVKRPAARPSRGALKRTPAQVHTHTQTYADIRRPMQMRPDPTASSRSVHANPLRSMNARPQRQALGARPATQKRSATMRACPCARWFQSLTTATQAHAARRLFSRYPHAADQLELRFTQPAPGRPDRARGHLSFRPRAIH